MSDWVPIRRALISVSDKTDLLPFARSLASRGVELLSTGGTAAALKAAGLPVTPVEEVTNFPEGLDGRVKTLHPAIHAGLLAVRDDATHQAFLAAHQFRPIDLVCINLYPFQRAVADPNVSLADAIENIDVGGPAMLRAAAKNHRFVTVVTSPSDYDRVIAELDANDARTSFGLRAELAAAAFARTAEYDAAIATFLSRRSPSPFPDVLRLRHTLVDRLRYGENPHQEAALYRDPASTGQSIVNALQLHGKQLSYNNILDASWALESVKSLERLRQPIPARSLPYVQASTASTPFDLPSLLPPAVAVVVKHTNPCGGAVASTLPAAVRAAVAGDPTAAYGGILALNRTVDSDTAAVIANASHFFEVVIAPEFDQPALETLRARWSAVRLLAVGDRAPSAARKIEYRSVPGGMLVQDRDVVRTDPSQWTHAAGPKPTPDHVLAACVIAELARSVTSNAVVIGGFHANAIRLFGVGSGQVDRVSACRLAVAKAADAIKSSAAAASGPIAVGDAFFPFPDGPKILIDAGVKLIVHPGGSKRDQETLDLCNTHNVTCLLTGVRHFRH
ncbi:MAG: bifunctional phosphoribosylaminoimidazolecarboxamide formyltransferase/IMP cyclohydrolase [Phycisphaeraceae bacterium]|nr:bifunctional phosphoribosylaminoimidazolecarboxamide formyltransferase/IMP cyclohydrolase [Phycisphaeraceae bacterium]